MTKNHAIIIWIVIRTKMCMSKIHTRTIWIFIRKKMCMTKIYTKIYTYMVIQGTKVHMTKRYNGFNSNGKIMKFTQVDKGQCEIMNY